MTIAPASFDGLLALSGVVFTAVLAAWTQIYLHRHVGKSNGQGTIARMIERVLEEGAAHRTEDRILFGHLYNYLGIDPPAGILMEDADEVYPVPYRSSTGGEGGGGSVDG